MARKSVSRTEMMPLDIKNLSTSKDKNDVKPLDTLYLRKGAGAVQIRVVSGKRSLLQRKAINALFKIAGDLGLEQGSYLTTRIAFSISSGFNSNDVAHLKATAAAITDMKVEFDVLNDENVRHVGSASLFSAIVFRSDGRIYFEIPELTKKMLMDEEKFALINMQVHADFESLYAYILYEHCLLYVVDGETPIWSIETWKEFLEIDEDQTTYHEFKFFNNKVIKFAVNEVNKIGDIIIEPVYHKNGRVITHISFNVEKKPQALLNFFTINQSLELEQKIVDYGVTEKVAQKLLREYDRERIIGNMEYVEKQFGLGKVSDPAAFLVKAITDDYRPKDSPLVKKVKEQQEADAAKKVAATREKEKVVAERNSQFAEETDRAQNYYDNLHENEKTDLLESFSHHLANTNSIIFNQYKTSGLKSKTAKTSLIAFVKDNYLNR